MSGEELHKKVEDALDEIRPFLESDGGNISLVSIEKNINVPVLGIIENMSYFTPAELPENKYYIFGEDGAKHLAEDLETAFLGEIPLVQGIREGGDFGHPVALQDGTPQELAFKEITKNMAGELVKRNTDLPPTEAVKITTMSGCSTKK